MPGHSQKNANWNRNRSRNRKKRSKNAFPGKAAPKCPYCGQNVRDVLTAIETIEDNSPVHFDCVLKKIAENENLESKEKVCYLGNGSFGIVQFQNPSDPSRFVIKKRFQVEDERKEIAWRKAVRVSR